MAQLVQNLPAMQETQVSSLGQENPLEKEMTVSSSIFAWRIPWTERAWWATVYAVTESDKNELLTLALFSSYFKNFLYTIHTVDCMLNVNELAIYIFNKCL